MCRSISESLYLACVVPSRHCVELVAGMQQHLQNYPAYDLTKFIPGVRNTRQSVDSIYQKNSSLVWSHLCFWVCFFAVFIMSLNRALDMHCTSTCPCLIVASTIRAVVV